MTARGPAAKRSHPHPGTPQTSRTRCSRRDVATATGPEQRANPELSEALLAVLATRPGARACASRCHPTPMPGTDTVASGRTESALRPTPRDLLKGPEATAVSPQYPSNR